jgi:hypothetical protein
MTSSALLTIHINLFHGSYDPRPAKTLTLEQALEHIRYDTYRYQIEDLRSARSTHGKSFYDGAKKQLDAYTFAGVFQQTRTKQHLLEHSGLVHLDYDGVTDVARAKIVLCAVPTVAYIFISPSGLGLKVGVHVPRVTDDTGYKHAWQIVSDYLTQHYDVIADPSGKDISRLCFVSWDPDLYLNLDAAVFPIPPLTRQSPRPPAPVHPSPTEASKRRQQYVEQAIARAVRLIASSYPSSPGIPGTRHLARLKASRLLGGYVGGNLLSYDEAYHILEVVVAEHTVHFAKSMRTIADGLRYGMRTPVTFEQLEQERLAWCAARGYTPQPEEKR